MTKQGTHPVNDKDYEGTTWLGARDSKMTIDAVRNGIAFCRHIPKSPNGNMRSQGMFELPFALLLNNRLGWRLQK